MPSSTPEKPDDTNRSQLEKLAYRMLGTWADAEDIAQESLLKWHALPEKSQIEIHEPLAWLSKVATRLSLDKLKSAQRRREKYVGPWLPEPILIDEAMPSDRIDKEESVNMAFMLALECLSPSERAAFLLHDIFDYPFETVADILEKTTVNCRKLASRARAAILEQRSRLDFDPSKHHHLLLAFSRAVAEGNTQDLEHALAEDVALYSDGGGIAPAARKILQTREILIRLYLGLHRKSQKSQDQIQIELRPINGMPGLLHLRNGALESVLTISVKNDRIQSIYQQRNPEKLAQVARQLSLQPAAYKSPLP